MAQAREICRAAGLKRGRPLWLASRVAASEEACHHVGYDVHSWLDGGLLDYLIPSACYEMDPGIDGAWWVAAAAAAPSPPRVYPSLGGVRPRAHANPCTVWLQSRPPNIEIPREDPDGAGPDRAWDRDFLCLITPLCSYVYGGLYGGLYERADIIRYFPLLSAGGS